MQVMSNLPKCNRLSDTYTRYYSTLYKDQIDEQLGAQLDNFECVNSVFAPDVVSAIDRSTNLKSYPIEKVEEEKLQKAKLENENLLSSIIQPPTSSDTIDFDVAFKRGFLSPFLAPVARTNTLPSKEQVSTFLPNTEVGPSQPSKADTTFYPEAQQELPQFFPKLFESAYKVNKMAITSLLNPQPAGDFYCSTSRSGTIADVSTTNYHL